MTKDKINRAIKHTGLTLVGNRGDGYCYFLNTDGDQVGQSAMVCYLNQLTLEQWVEAAEASLL